MGSLEYLSHEGVRINWVIHRRLLEQRLAEGRAGWSEPYLFLSMFLLFVKSVILAEPFKKRARAAAPALEKNHCPSCSPTPDVPGARVSVAQARVPSAGLSPHRSWNSLPRGPHPWQQRPAAPQAAETSARRHCPRAPGELAEGRGSTRSVPLRRDRGITFCGC